MPGEGVRCTCGAGHKTFGACMRDKGIGFNGVFVTRSNGAGRGDATAQKKWDAELDRYAAVRKDGIQPDGTSMDKVIAAEKKSEALGVAYGTDAYRAEQKRQIVEKYAD